MDDFRKNIYRTYLDSAAPPVGIEHLFDATGHTNPATACTFTSDDVSLYSLDATLIVGSIIYTDPAMTTTFNGLGRNWHTGGLPGFVCFINNVGVVEGIDVCT